MNNFVYQEIISTGKGRPRPLEPDTSIALFSLVFILIMAILVIAYFQDLATFLSNSINAVTKFTFILANVIGVQIIVINYLKSEKNGRLQRFVIHWLILICFSVVLAMGLNLVVPCVSYLI